MSKEEKAGVSEALRALVDKLEVVHADPAYKTVWFIAHDRAGPYAGPTYTAELEAAKAALSTPAIAAEPEPGDAEPFVTRRGWENLSCDDQFTLARQIAANVGYVLMAEPSIQDVDEPATPSYPEPTPATDPVAPQPKSDSPKHIVVAPQGAEPAAWRYRERGEWEYTDGPERPHPGNSYPVQPLYLAAPPAAQGVVGIKPLEWRVPNDDNPRDPDIEDNALCADGLGGVYAISKKQTVGPERLLWWAQDPMDWTGFNTIAEAKAAAQSDYEARIRSALDLPSPPTGESRESFPNYSDLLARLRSSRFKIRGEAAKAIEDLLERLK